MTNKYTVQELVEAISSLEPMEAVVVCDILSGQVSDRTKVHIRIRGLIIKEQSDLLKAIANWNLNFPAHKDDAILTLLDEVLENVICQQQPGKETETEQ